jgi:hypothetical protein
MRLAIAKCFRRGMNRIVAGNQIMLVRSSRTQNKLTIGQSFEFDRFIRRREDRKIAAPKHVRRRNGP